MVNMKKQFAILQKEAKQKDDEIERLRRTSKVTKLNEIQTENLNLIDELNRVKALYNIVLQNNVVNE